MGLKKLLFLKNAVILTGTALLLRAVGMFFRVYIAGQVGDEGMGLYQLIFTLYNLAITLATSGVTVATTRLAADWLARDRGAPRTLCRRLIFYAFCLGGTAGLLQFFLARPASTLWLGDAPGRALAAHPGAQPAFYGGRGDAARLFHGPAQREQLLPRPDF